MSGDADAHDGHEDGDEDEGYVRLVRRVHDGGSSEDAEDLVVREEPLEIRLRGVPLAVVMRTPGHDEDLTWGFLMTERIVTRADEVVSVRHCSTVSAPEAEDNIMQVGLAPEVEVDLERLRRNLYASSSCGICGKATIENVLDTAPPIESGVGFSVETLYQLPDRLASAQALFSRTGGLHAAGIFDAAGDALVVREDVGRHNATDKAIGFALRSGLDLSEQVLIVSGRVSYEIVQKALAARIPAVAAVSAPSSLAIELAREANMLLVGFLRGHRLCAYAGEERLS